MREFNVTGLCLPNRHYMADISEKVRQIVDMVEKEKYFTINRGRQYGKTTTIRQLEKALQKKDYQVARISFEGIGDTPFENEEKFCQNIIDQISRAINRTNPEYAKAWINDSLKTFKELDMFLNEVCKNEKVVLIIDETDKTSNNFVFLRFVGMLRDKYLERDNGESATFQSVILAGVYDIKNLKLKMIQAGTHQLQDGEKRINSPWNIAIDFKIDMSLNEKEIASMLVEYENDHKTGMDIEAIAKEIRAYTNGYPYLVSRICQNIEEDLGQDWTLQGVQNAVKEILFEQTTLFDDIFKNIESNPDLKDLLRELTVGNRAYLYSIDNQAIQLASIYGIVEKRGNLVAIHNRIFEVRITNYFASEKELRDSKLTMRASVECVTAGNKLNMEMLLKRFAEHYYEMYNNKDIDFLERECRLLFITYLRPFINGTGFYHLESEVRSGKRTDVIVDYLSEQFIVELKLWYGEVAHENAFEQVSDYLSSKNKDIGYLLTFDFRKEQNVGKPQAQWIEHKGKKILDVMVGI
ncbi:MAG: AAA-like domain-containing protein [Fibromonadales bacterium]|nr:AAA-like domain-containing protein [Fibromonadales bacterium]